VLASGKRTEQGGPRSGGRSCGTGGDPALVKEWMPLWPTDVRRRLGDDRMARLLVGDGERVFQFIHTAWHRERRCAAPARRATEAYCEVRRKERNAAGADAAALECRRMDELKHWTGCDRGRPLRRSVLLRGQ